MKFLPSISQRKLRQSAGLLVTLSLLGCTEKSKPFVPPAPTPPVPAATANNEDAKDYAQYTELAWSDEFDGTALDATKWSPEVRDVWYNNEKEATTSSLENVNVTGGNLNIIAKKEDYNGQQYTSARIISKGKKEFVFGRIDTRAKLPKGQGLWPAIWMLGANDSQVSWPACGEIDIMEVRGSRPNNTLTTLHYGTSVADHKQKGTDYTLPGTDDFSTDFHIFSVVRSRDQMRFFVDGNLYYTVSSSDISPYPFNNTFYMILNVAVGGDFGGDPNASTTFPQRMQVDYVRYYQYK